jgi:hypothetical protein
MRKKILVSFESSLSERICTELAVLFTFRKNIYKKEKDSLHTTH